MKISIKPKIWMAAFLLLFQACQNAERHDETINSGYSPEDPDEIYAEHVRSTSFQTPEEEKKSFILPPGFEITLFASEPDITKPINMAFDDKGRLWVTQSSEYPIKAGEGEGTDRISILEDTNRDGTADKIIHFAEDLNIPIGIIPVHDGVIAYSIPNIYRFYDTNNDGKEDRREILLGEFEHKDTHGMVNNLFRGFDGWIHASHGFSNISVVAGSDGDSVKMVSGNTFRFRSDGSRVEKTTDGRINPFGSDYDELGYHYSADCHTLPIFQLIWNGNYTQWGKKEPNMGFAPTMMDYDLNSTALAGLVFYTDNQFPEPYQNSFYSGDVVTCRISRSTMEFNGTTPKATRQKDFLVSKDPWFRPVDIKIGPDGAMYVADFYNPIIGHYEVPLDHPDRDRISGRIWKITYKGKERAITNWSDASEKELIEGLNHEVLHQRMAATDALLDRFGEKAIGPLKELLNNKKTNPNQLIQGLWGLSRLQPLNDADFLLGLKHEDPKVRVHSFRILANRTSLNSQQNSWAIAGLQDKDPHVQRAAAEVLVRHPHLNGYRPLIEKYAQIPDFDTHLSYTLKLAIFHHVQQENIIKRAMYEDWSEEEMELLATIVSDTETPQAGDFLFSHLKKRSEFKPKDLAYLTSIVRNVHQDQLAEVISYTKERSRNDTQTNYKWAMAVQDGVTQRGGSPPNALREWYADLAKESLMNKPQQPSDWTSEEQERQIFAAEITGKYKFVNLTKDLKELVQSAAADEETKAAAARSLMEMNPRTHISFLNNILADYQQKASYRQKIAQAIGQANSKASRVALSDHLKGAPPELQQTVADILVNNAEGMNLLLENIRKGNAPARVLQSGNVRDRFLATANENQKQEYEALTANLLPISEERQKLIVQRIEGYQSDDALLAGGKVLYEQNCSACHQINNNGGEIGPQLDGIGNWGLNALATKVLDPNRNISENFRTYNITLTNGQTLSGLYRRDEGQSLIMANQSGKEFTVSKQEIAEQNATKSTLMPDHFSSTLNQDQFNELMAYLLSVR